MWYLTPSTPNQLSRSSYLFSLRSFFMVAVCDISNRCLPVARPARHVQRVPELDLSAARLHVPRHVPQGAAQHEAPALAERGRPASGEVTGTGYGHLPV